MFYSVRKDGTPIDEGEQHVLLCIASDKHARVALIAYRDSIKAEAASRIKDIDIMIEYHCGKNGELECHSCGEDVDTDDPRWEWKDNKWYHNCDGNALFSAIPKT